MIKTFTKRTLALLLCVVMLVSCWVFTAPTASAAYANEQGKYCVRIMYREIDDFNLPEDNNDYSAGIINGDKNSSTWSSYVTITYKENNGSSSSEKKLTFNIGDKDNGGRSDIVSGSGHDYGYFPYDTGYEISGFPTGFSSHIAKANPGINVTVGAGQGTLYLQLAKWNSTTKDWDWSDMGGTCPSSTKEISKNSSYGYFFGSIGSCYKQTKVLGTGWTKNGEDSEDIAATVADEAKPVPATVSNLDYSNITAASGATSSTTKPIVIDNYGVKLLAPTISYIASSYKYDSTSGTTIPTANKDYAINASTGVISAATGGYVANGHSTHSLAIRASAQFNGVTKYSSYKYITITYPEYSVNWNYYTSTSDSETGVLNTAENTVLYGDTPVMPNAANVTSYYDSEQHHSGGAYNIPAKATNDQDLTMQYETNEDHIKTTDVKTKPNCTENGFGIVSCEDCDYSTNTTIDALGHSMQRIDIEPGNGTKGLVYFKCSNCKQYQGAEYNETDKEYKPVGKLKEDDANIDANTQKVPSTVFNEYTENVDFDHTYANRGGSLNIAGPSVVDFTSESALNKITQGMRFTASLLLPEGIALNCSESDNYIVDFGFLWSQVPVLESQGMSASDLRFNESTEATELPKNVYKMSVVKNNKGVDATDGTNDNFTGDNWTGVSAHEDSFTTGGTALTFNILINVKARNWQKDYCVRPYIKYKYNGTIYTIYDDGNGFDTGYSRNVAYIADKVVKNEEGKETQRAIDYCQHKIIDNLGYIPA